jgi:hypothetical protein
MRATLFLIPLALSSAACSSPAEIEQATGLEGQATPRALARAEAEATSAFEDDEERNGGSREFRYAWPAAVTAEPARILAQEKDEWTEALSDSPEDCTPCRNRSLTKEWKVVASTPGYLSLSADFSTYTGGAHGMYGLQSLVWDKAKQSAMSGAEMFRSPEALDAALGPRLCSALNAERAKRRGESVPQASEDTFDRCVGTAEATVLVGSSTGKAFNRLGIWFGPYVAGFYAEGAYELDFPVDAAVLRAVKPEFAPAFAVWR